MKKFTLVKLLCMLVVLITLATAASGAGFTKTLTYTDDTFKDVKSTSWYAKEVASAYELGFMNGKAEGQFSPDGNVTVAEAITMASRVHAIYNGKEIAKADGKWYEMYVKYALENGIIAEGQFDNFNRNIMRYEMAVMFHDAMPKGYYNAINNVKAIPDVAETEEYHEKLMTLYNAGIVMGSTDFGDFLATNSIKRSETAAIINRVALPENRQKKTLLEYGNRDQAVYLIDDFEMMNEVRGVRSIMSGWTYENTANPARDAVGSTNSALADSSKESFVAIHRDITTQTRGIVKLETVFSTTEKSGARVYFSDINGNILFELATRNGKLYAIGNSEAVAGDVPSDNNYGLYTELNLDTKKATVVLNNVLLGTFDMNAKAADISEMSFSTTKEDELLIGVSEVHMYINYDVIDLFRLGDYGKAPYGWTVNNAVVAEKNADTTGPQSVKISGQGSAVKKFDAVSGKFVYETFVLVPDSQKLCVSLKNGEETAVKVEAANNKFTASSGELRSFSSKVWQLIRIEGDTDKKTGVIKINNKKTATVDMKISSIDTIEIAAFGSGDLWFDDVKLYNVFDYADYVPTPVPVTDDGYYSGMSSCSLWHSGAHYGWDYIAPYDERTPVIGYYDEGLPEVADWEIKFQVEHGYDFQQYCWFVANQKDEMKIPRLSEALHDGYMNAKYSDMQDFVIMWENAGANNVTLDYFKNYIWPYWVDWYLTDSRYFVIDNKPVINIYRFNKFIDHMGGEDGAKQATDFMRAEIKKYGFDDVILITCDNLTKASEAEKIEKIGIDAAISYTLGEMSYDADYQKDATLKAFENGKNSTSFLPSIGMGFNILAWNGVRTPLATEETFGEVYSWAKNTYLPMVASKETNAKDSWMGKFFIATTWNEYGEGHYIMPTNLNKFGYVDAARKVVSSVAGKDDSAHFDVVPTDTQKARLGYLYPATVTRMKRTYLIENESGNTGADYSKNIPTLSWDFEKDGEALAKNWQRWNAKEIADMKYDSNEKAFYIKTTGNDPSIRLDPSKSINIDGDASKILHIQMKVSKGATSSIEVFFTHATDSSFSGAKGVNTKLLSNGEYNDYYIELSKNANWADKITGLRLDPVGEPSEVYIKKIEFLSDKVVGATTIVVDGAETEFGVDFVKTSGDEIFVAGDPDKGFYSLLNLFYEWDRWNGKLMVKADNGTVMNFTVGSDKVNVNGKDEKLPSTVDVYDGLVMVPFNFICEKAGYEVKKDNGTYSVEVREGYLEKLEETNKENWFEFNITGDTQGFITNNGTGSVLNGIYTLTATPVTNAKTGYDASIAHKALRVNTSFYKTVEVRLRCLLEDPDADPGVSKIYFATDLDGSLSESKTLRFNLSDYEQDYDGFTVVRIDASQNENWVGSVNQIRFDPSDFGGYYEFDYIRFIADENYEQQLEEAKKEAERANELLMDVDNGAPFYIQNAAAEISTSNANLRKNTSIAEDELIEGNHAYKVVPENLTAKSWVYFIAPTRFLPGATYKVSFDARVLYDHEGNPAKNVLLSWNLRYAEEVNGKLDPNANHYDTFRDLKLSTEDGWVHYEFTTTINSNIPDQRQYDCFCIFVDPADGGSKGFLNYTYMVDNIKVEIGDPAENGVMKAEKLGYSVDVDGLTSSEKENISDAEAKKEEIAAQVTGPFVIVNADAEDASGASNPALRANTTIVADDLIEGNHAYKVVPENETAKSWVYFIAPTTFAPGAKYKVSFDVRIVSDHNGNDADNALLSWNLRFPDYKDDGSVDNNSNHYASYKDRRISTKDGWQHFEFEYEMPTDIPTYRNQDKFCLFVDPNDGGQDGFINFIYMVDNIKVELVK